MTQVLPQRAGHGVLFIRLRQASHQDAIPRFPISPRNSSPTDQNRGDRPRSPGLLRAPCRRLLSGRPGAGTRGFC